MPKSLYFLDAGANIRTYNGSSWSVAATLPDTLAYGMRWIIPWRGKLAALVESGAQYRIRTWDGSMVGDYTGAAVQASSTYNGDGTISEPVIYHGHIVWLARSTLGAVHLQEWDGSPAVYSGSDIIPGAPYTSTNGAPASRDAFGYPYTRLVPFGDRLVSFSSGTSPFNYSGGWNVGVAACGFMLIDCFQQSVSFSFKQSALGYDAAGYCAVNYGTRYTTSAAVLNNVDTTPVGFFTLNNKLFYVSVTGLIQQVDPVTGGSTLKYDLKTGTTGNPLYCGTIALINTSGVTKVACAYNAPLANRQRFLLGGKIVPTSGTYSGVELCIHATAAAVSPEQVSIYCTSRADGSYVPLVSNVNADIWIGLGSGIHSDGNGVVTGRASMTMFPGVMLLGAEYGGYAYVVILGQHTNGSNSYPGGCPSFVLKYDGTTTAPTVQRIYINTNQDPDCIGAAIALDDESGLINIVYHDAVLAQDRHIQIDTSLTVTDVGSIAAHAVSTSNISQNAIHAGCLCMWDPLAPTSEVIPPTLDNANTAVDVPFDIQTSDNATVNAVVEYSKGPGQVWSTATRKGSLGEALTGLSTVVTAISYPMTSDPGVGTKVNGATFASGYLNLALYGSRAYAAFITPAISVSSLMGVHVSIDQTPLENGSWGSVFGNAAGCGWSFNFGDPTQISAGATTGWAVPGSSIVSVGFGRLDTTAIAGYVTALAQAGGVSASPQLCPAAMNSPNGFGQTIGANTVIHWDIWIVFLSYGTRIRMSGCGYTFDVVLPAVLTPLSTWTCSLFGYGTGAAVDQRFKNLVVRPMHRFSHDAGTDITSYVGPLQYRVRGTR